MRMGMRLIEWSRGNKVRCVQGKVIKKKKKKKEKIKNKRQKNRDSSTTKMKVAGVRLQRLYETCQQVYRGPGTDPSPPDVQILRNIIDCMLPEDFGLSPELQFFNPSTSTAFNEVQRVTKTTIYECRNFSMCIFFVPAKAVIPLHNHPGMTVFSKLLQGTMHIKSYDWVDPIIVTSNHQTSSKLRLGKLKANDVVEAPCDTWVLYPQSGGNIHEFKAITPCAMLDVIGPPYSKEIAQDCKYYRDSPVSSGRSEEEAKWYGWLEEIETPKEAVMDEIQYFGPQISLSLLNVEG